VAQDANSLVIAPGERRFKNVHLRFAARQLSGDQSFDP
jgi:hypothetical protein